MNLEILAPAVVNGVVIGALYSLVALAIVLLFNTSGVANFAVGNMAMFSSLLVYRVVVADRGIGGGTGLGPTLFRFAIAMVIGGLLGAVIYIVVMAARPGFGPMNGTFRTLGVYLLLAAIADRLWAAGQPYFVDSLISRDSFKVAGFAVSYDQLAIVVIAGLLALALFTFFARTGLGLQMRAVASHRSVASLIGIDVRRIELLAWVVTGIITGIVGLLFAPVTVVTTSYMNSFFVSAFVAAIVGGIYSFAGAVLAGVSLGVIFSVAGAHLAAEWREALTLILLAVVLAIRPYGIFGVPAGETRV